MTPLDKLPWAPTFKRAFYAIGAIRARRYSWCALAGEQPVLFIELDHIYPERCQYDHEHGVLKKRIRGGHTGVKGAGAREMFNMVEPAFEHQTPIRLMLTRGSHYAKFPGFKKGAAVEPDQWLVTSFSGSLHRGFRFTARRIET